MYGAVRNVSLKYKWQLISVVLLVATLVLCSFLPTLEQPSRPHSSTATYNTTFYNSSNAVTNFADSVSVSAGAFAREAGYHISCYGAVAVTGLSNLGTVTVSHMIAGIDFLGDTAVHSATYVGRLLYGRYTNSINYPVAMVNATAEANVMGGFIRPIDNVELPTIQTVTPEPGSETSTAISAQATPSQPAGSDSVPQWPMHGAITTYFGVPHWPYQPTHTGMDISDGKRVGVTPIHPFKPGQVTEVVRSNKGLGNHVVVDNGNGITSVYAHLNSTSVEVGQFVTKQTVLGYEGTTGTSTGPHLHFEIKLNGVYMNPQDFISGQP